MRIQRVLKIGICSFAVAAMVLPIWAESVNPDQFRYHCTITFSGYSGASTLSDFPALVRIPSGSPIYAASALDGRDIRFADALGNLVPHEIDTWNTSGESLVWVKVPTLSGTETTLALYCGAVQSADATTLLPPTNVWNAAGYKGVWHFSGSNADSSPNALVGTDSATAPTYNTAGKVGTAFGSSGSSYIQIANSTKWAGYNGNSLAVSAWVKTDVTESRYDRIFSCKGVGDNSVGVQLQMQGAKNRFNAVAATGSANTQNAQYITPLDAGVAFVYLTAVYADGTIQMYANGEKVGAAKSGVVPGTPEQVLRIGAAATSLDYNWNGSLDEVRFQWAAQSVDWVAADYATQNNNDFAVLGDLEENTALKVDESAFSRKLTVTFSGYEGSSTLENFPALVRIPSGVSAYCGKNGEKMCFADADGFLVPHEIDTWDRSGTSFVWVRVPRLSGTTTALTLYAGAVPVNAPSSRSVWAGSGYKGVWHFSGSNADSSSNNLAGTNAGSPSYVAMGKVGNAFSTSGSSFLNIANDASWAGYDGNHLTVSVWVKTSVADNGYGRPVSFRKTGDYGLGFEISQQGQSTRFNAIGCDGPDNDHRAQCVQTISQDASREYVYLTVVCDSGDIQMYANGAPVGDPPVKKAIIPQTDAILRIGGRSETTSNGWNGQLDEVRLQWGSQSADWIAADYKTQAASDFAVLGEMELLHGIMIIVQ